MGDLRIRYVPLNDLKPARRNPKRHALDVIQASMARFDYTKPALLDERTGRLVAGHGRREALIALRDSGGDPPEGVRKDGKDWLMPVIHGWRSKNDREAEAYVIADNRTQEAGGNDDAVAALMLKDQDLIGIGYTQDEVDAMSRALPSPDDVEFPEMGEGVADQVAKVECPKCHHKFVP